MHRFKERIIGGAKLLGSQSEYPEHFIRPVQTIGDKIEVPAPEPGNLLRAGKLFTVFPENPFRPGKFFIILAELLFLLRQVFVQGDQFLVLQGKCFLRLFPFGDVLPLGDGGEHRGPVRLIQGGGVPQDRS